MEQSPSWEANRSLASQEIPRIVRDQKVHYRIHKSPPPDPILNHSDPFHAKASVWGRVKYFVTTYIVSTSPNP